MTAKAMTNLKKAGLSVDWVLQSSESEIDEQIKMVGFHNKKAMYGAVARHMALQAKGGAGQCIGSH